MPASKLFFSYCHADEGLRNELAKHLSLMVREGLISPWHDRCIEAGATLDNEINDRLEEADIILLLVSADFINSDYCYSREMTRALEKHETGEARVIPVILRHCDWHSAPFGKLNALPTDGKAVRSFADMDEGFTDIAKGLRRVAGTLEKNRHPVSSQNRTAAPAVVPEKARHPVAAKSVKLPKKFTDFDKDRFVGEAFRLTADFFSNSLQQLEMENPGYQTSFEPIDSKKFRATVYVNGDAVARCYIRLGSAWGRGTEEILYSSGRNESFSDTSYNKILSVESTDHELFLKALMSMSANDNLSPLQAAEYLWDDFVSGIR